MQLTLVSGVSGSGKSVALNSSTDGLPPSGAIE